MEFLKPPAELVLSGNVAENWRRFRQQLELFLKATESTGGRTDAQKIALLLHVAGEEAQDVYNTFEDTSKDTYDAMLKKFEEYCMPKKNETYERYVSRMGVQEEGEPFEQFFRDLQLKIQSCQFSDLKDSLLREQIVYGIADCKLRQRMLREQDLSLEQVVRMCRAEEVAKKRDEIFQEAHKTLPKIAKRLLQKAARGKESFWLALLNYRASPLEDGRCPSELLMGRRLRTRLPDFSADDSQEVWKRKQPKRGRLLPVLKKGDVVRFREDRGWKIKAQVQQQVAPRSYTVVTEDGTILRRNRQHLLSTEEQYEPIFTDDCGQTLGCFRSPEIESGSQSPARPTCSTHGPSATSQPQLQPPAAQSPPPEVVEERRSARHPRPPARLTYDENFQQLA